MRIWVGSMRAAAPILAMMVIPLAKHVAMRWAFAVRLSIASITRSGFAAKSSALDSAL